MEENTLVKGFNSTLVQLKVQFILTNPFLTAVSILP